MREYSVVKNHCSIFSDSLKLEYYISLLKKTVHFHYYNDAQGIILIET